MKQKFTDKLKKLDFSLAENLYLINSEPQDAYIRFALEEAKKFKVIEDAKKPKEVTAVYFRKFEDGSRPALPQAYIFDFTDDFELSTSFGETVKNIWLSSKIPLIYAFTKTDIIIFSGYQQPEYKNSAFKPSIIDIIEIADFSAKRLDNGSFWNDQNYQKYFKFENSSYEILLKKLKNILDEIVEKEQNQNKKEVKEFYQKLLLRSILVKYLEERTDKNGDRIFNKGFFKEFSELEDSFISVLKRKGAIVELFQTLENQFNGNIFNLDKRECEILRNKDLSLFLDVFDSCVDQRKQLHIWKLYSFNYLPVELISNIYEEFLPKVKGVVYTPPFLVDFLIDQCMPLKELVEETDNYKVVDPACGSGVFLVAAFKRLVQAWRMKHNWEKPKIEVLQQILKTKIFGIDIQKESIQLAAFSLTIALCDQLSPKKIRNLKFDDLTEKNLIEKDFFSIILNDNNMYDEFQNTFDLVIGNPPFESEIKNDALIIENKMLLLRDFKIPDNQLALLFLEQVSNLCKKNKQCCLIQKGGPFLYNLQSSDFRSYIFQNINITHVYDFSALKPSLYGKANVETTAVFIKNTSKLTNNIYHIILQNTRTNNNKMYFEIDRYDFHKINRKKMGDNKFIWVVNLLGGGRLNNIVNNLNKVRSLKDFLISKKENGWKYAEGYIALTPKASTEFYDLQDKINPSENDIKKLQKLEQKYTAEYLTNKSTISLEKSINFTSDGINQNSIVSLNKKYFLRNRKKNKEIFFPPHLLLREIAPHSGIPVEYREDFLSFTNQIIGIHSQDSTELIKIENWMKHNTLLVFYLYLRSSRGITSRPGSFLLDDILSIPYPENFEEIKLSSYEQILIDDVLEYQIDFRREGEKAKVLEHVEQPNLIEFSKVYLKVLNSVYKQFKAAEPIETTSFICYPFYFDEKPEQDLEKFKNNTDILEKHLESLIKHQPTSTLRINRILRIYEKNIIYLIKPNQLRYWLKSIAIRDADETVADFIEQGF